MINDRATMGSEMINMVAQRLSYIVFVWDAPRSLDRLACCSVQESTWLRGLVSYCLYPKTM